MMDKSNQYITLRYFDFHIKVGSVATEDLMWLDEFLIPSFERVENGACDCEIRLTCDDMAFDQLKSSPPDGQDEVAGFVLDKKIVNFKVWQSDRDQTTYYDEEFDVFYVLNRDQTDVMVLAHSVGSLGKRTALMRVIREYAINHVDGRDGYFIHAGAFACQRKGIMVAGYKNAGKTSTLTYFLRNLDSRYISNDRVFVHSKGSAAWMNGMPTVVTVSEEGLGRFPDLEKIYHEHNYHHRYTIKEIHDNGNLPYEPEQGDYTVSPGQYCQWLGVKAIGSAALHAIVFPRICEETQGMKIRTLPVNEACEYLQKAKISQNFDEECSVFHLESHGARRNRREGYNKFMARLAANQLCLECRLGPDAFKTDRGAQMLTKLITKEAEQLV